MIDASKYACSLLLLFSVPFFFESQFVINLWLKNPPQYTAMFCVADLVLVLITSTFRPLTYALYATGEIRLMSFLNGVLFLSALPVAYVLLITGQGPIAPWIAKCIIQVLVAFTNLLLVKRNIPEFDVPCYLKNTVLPLLAALIITLPVTYLVYNQFSDSSWWRFLSTCAASSVAVCLTVFFIVFDKKMRLFVINKAKEILKIK